MSEAVQEIIMCVMSCIELALAWIWAISYTKVRRKNDELEATVLLLTERLKIAGDLLERESKRRAKEAPEGAKPGYKLTVREEDEPFEELNARAICIDPRKKNDRVKIPSRWEDGK